jgi:hypothetical protein
MKSRDFAAARSTMRNGPTALGLVGFLSVAPTVLAQTAARCSARAVAQEGARPQDDADVRRPVETHEVGPDGVKPLLSPGACDPLKLAVSTWSDPIAPKSPTWAQRLTFASSVRSSDRPLRLGLLTNADELGGQTWKFVTSTSYKGPAGLRVGVTAVGTRGYSRPLFATQLIGSDADSLPVNGALVDMSRRTV